LLWLELQLSRRDKSGHAYHIPDFNGKLSASAFCAPFDH
jgi:hypothetical protein